MKTYRVLVTADAKADLKKDTKLALWMRKRIDRLHGMSCLTFLRRRMS